MGNLVTDDALDAYVDDILGEEPEEVTPEPEEVLEDAEGEQEEQAEEESEEEETLELRHNGKPIKLKLDEVIEHAQKGFDYTHKTQELAEQRRNVEQYAQHIQEQAKFQQQFQAEMAEISAMDMQLRQYEQVNWSAYTDQDPVEATKQFQKYQMLMQQRNAKSGELGSKYQAMQQQQAQMREVQLAEAFASLERDLGKEWNHETRKALKATGAEYGYSDEELSSISDPRAIKVLLDAKKWRDLQAKKPEITKKVNEAPKMAKPGATPAHANEKTQKLSKILKTSKDRRARENAAFSLLDKYV